MIGLTAEVKLDRLDLSKYKKSVEKPEKKSLQALRRDIETCFGTSCNFCEKDCQVYQIKKVKTYTSRGKNRTMLGILEGKVAYTDELADLFYTCTLCASCDARCAFRNTHRFLELRRELVRHNLGKNEHKAAVDVIVEKGDMLGDIRSPAKVFEEDIKRARANAKYVVPMFVGCMYKSMAAELRTIISVLGRLGVAVELVDESCCGYPVYSLGYENEFDAIKGKFKSAVGKHAENGVLTVCPTCTAFLNEEYGINAVHAVELVSDLIEGKVKKKLDMKATYHDPCHLGRGLGVTEQPRKIIKSLGIDLVEMSANRLFSRCCGGGGGMLIRDRALSEEIAKRRLDQARDAGVDKLIVSCPTCDQNLSNASFSKKEKGQKRVKVVNLWSLLEESLVQ